MQGVQRRRNNRVLALRAQPVQPPTAPITPVPQNQPIHTGQQQVTQELQAEQA